MRITSILRLWQMSSSVIKREQIVVTLFFLSSIILASHPALFPPNSDISSRRRDRRIPNRNQDQSMWQKHVVLFLLSTLVWLSHLLCADFLLRPHKNSPRNVDLYDFSISFFKLSAKELNNCALYCFFFILKKLGSMTLPGIIYRIPVLTRICFISLGVSFVF